MQVDALLDLTEDVAWPMSPLAGWYGDTEDGYSRWPDRAADPRRLESVFRRFGLPDHVD